MRVVQFDDTVRFKLKEQGFTHVEIRNTITDEGLFSPVQKSIKTFKALERIDTMPPGAHCVTIDSSEIDRFLKDERLNCYIVIPDIRGL